MNTVKLNTAPFTNEQYAQVIELMFKLDELGYAPEMLNMTETEMVLEHFDDDFETRIKHLFFVQHGVVVKHRLDK